MSATFTSLVPEVLTELQKKKNKILEICGGKAETYAKKLCPVGTPESTGKPGYIGGTLKNSITHQQLDADSEVIGSNVYYAPYVELGTVKMKARPFLRRALEEHMDEYKGVIEQVMKS
jgi:HK97 gp10 family phage protein